MIPFNLSPLVDSITLPDDYSGETLELGWRRVSPDLRSRDGFRWPWPGRWTDVVDADTSDEECAPGLHVAVGWVGASSTGPVHTALLVAYRPADVAHRGSDKVRVRQALTLDVFDPPAMIRAGHFTGANLTGANLYGADLTWANLTEANLYGANLYRADLTGANLYRADLTRADLSGANLYRADLTRADLSGANLSGANLTGASLTGADLTGASLTGADLTGASLTGADLTGASLTRANLTWANLYRADLTGADLYGAEADEHTVWPAGFSVPATVVTS